MVAAVEVVDAGLIVCFYVNVTNAAIILCGCSLFVVGEVVFDGVIWREMQGRQ